jgi:cobalt/nickel transport system permease protein
MNRDRVFLVAYLAAVVAATSIHRVEWLAAALVVVLALAGRDAGRVVRRSAVAVAAFTGVVTVTYAALAAWRGEFSWYFVALLNVRVFVLTSMSVLFAMRVNPFRAIDFSRTLVHVVTVAYSQAQTFRRLHDDFGHAFTSRSVGRVRARDRYRHAAATASFFLRRALRQTGDITLAMTSRGFFDDPR